MDYEAHVEATEREAAAITAALREASPEAQVPTCPEWAVLDLARHVGEFCGLWAHVLCEGTGRPKPPFEGPPADASGLADWYSEAAGHLVDELRATPTDTQVWSWIPEQTTAAFVARRCAHELSVHRIDAQLARGRSEPIDADLAADGIEEIFVMIGAWGPPAGTGSGQTLHLHGTDRPDDEWLLTLAPEGLGVDRRHAKGDLGLRGTVSDLELVLYQRPSHGTVERHGDETVLAAWQQAFTFG